MFGQEVLADVVQTLPRIVFQYKGVYDVQRAKWLRSSAEDRPVRLRRGLEGFTLSHCTGSYIRGCQFWLAVAAAGG